MLAMVEYAYNNLKHSATKIWPLYANYRYEPFTNWHTEIQFRNATSELYRHNITAVYFTLSDQLAQLY